MSPAVAVAVITWVAIVVLYLGLAAVLREVKMLRAQVTRMAVVTADGDQAVPSGGTQSAPSMSMPAVPRDGQPAVVLAADSSCPLCRMTIGRMAELADQLPEQPVLLTYETPEQWGPLPPVLRVVRDEDAWSQIAHMSPPVLLQVDGRGRVQDLALPAREDDVDATLSSWGIQLTPPTRK